LRAECGFGLTTQQKLQQLQIQLKAATNGVYSQVWKDLGGLYSLSIFEYSLWEGRAGRLTLAIKKFCQVKLPKIANCLDYAMFKDMILPACCPGSLSLPVVLDFFECASVCVCVWYALCG